MVGFSLFVVDLILYKYSVTPAYYREIYQEKRTEELKKKRDQLEKEMDDPRIDEKELEQLER